MNINEYISNNRTSGGDCPMVKEVKCKDGFHMSVQASEFHYCSPRQNYVQYDSVEIGFPSEVEPLLMEWAEPLLMEWAEDSERPTDTVYGWVPVRVVEEVIEKHGGLVD